MSIFDGCLIKLDFFTMCQPEPAGLTSKITFVIPRNKRLTNNVQKNFGTRILISHRVIKLYTKPNLCCQKLPKDGAESSLFSNMSTGLVDIYEVKRSQRHPLAVTKTTDWFRLLQNKIFVTN